MFANRFTAFTDACVLVSPLKRNMLPSLAAAEFFRVRWSAHVLDEVERAICRLRERKGIATAAADATRARQAMEKAFEEAPVTGFELRLSELTRLPDANDAHVIAAAVHVTQEPMSSSPTTCVTSRAIPSLGWAWRPVPQAHSFPTPSTSIRQRRCMCRPKCGAASSDRRSRPMSYCSGWRRKA